jgi:hypothetical protein
VRIKSVDQPAIQQLHRLRTQWMRPERRGSPSFAVRWASSGSLFRSVWCAPWKACARRSLNPTHQCLRSVRQPSRDARRDRRTRAEMQERRARTRPANELDQVVQRLLQIPGVGPLTATAMRASVVDVQRFPSGMHFASWLGPTSREHSSGERRRLGRISKQGDPYLRTLPIHGSRGSQRSARRWHSGQAARSARRLVCRSTSAAVTTGQPWHWLTSSLASSGLPGDTSGRSRQPRRSLIDPTHLQRHSPRFMFSETAVDAAEPITNLASKAPRK